MISKAAGLTQRKTESMRVFRVTSEYLFAGRSVIRCITRNSLSKIWRIIRKWMLLTARNHCSTFKKTSWTYAGRSWWRSTGRITLYSKNWIGVSRKHYYYIIEFSNSLSRLLYNQVLGSRI